LLQTLNYNIKLQNSKLTTLTTILINEFKINYSILINYNETLKNHIFNNENTKYTLKNIVRSIKTYNDIRFKFNNTFDLYIDILIQTNNNIEIDHHLEYRIRLNKNEIELKKLLKENNISKYLRDKIGDITFI
tara:strand:+ start:2645 stop:3043 length:399 start_codon:yes stop_codon:yes gene_type:complete